MYIYVHTLYIYNVHTCTLSTYIYIMNIKYNNIMHFISTYIYIMHIKYNNIMHFISTYIYIMHIKYNNIIAL